MPLIITHIQTPLQLIS